MGRKKRRRGRERTLEAPGDVGVDTIDLVVDDTTGELRPGAAAPPAATASPAAASAAVAVQTLGELLQQAREARGLSIEEASARTRISSPMLQHLEADRFGEFAADAYVKGFLRNYGAFLGLDVAMLLRRYEALSGRVVEREPELLEVETPSRPRRHRRRGRFWVAVLACVAVAALCWIFWSRAATRLGLRPTPGLEQIETELQGSTAPVRPALPDARSANDRADLDKLPLAVEPPPGPPPASVSPPEAGKAQTPAAKPAAKRVRAPAKPAATPRPSASAKPVATPGRAKPAERGPIEDLVPPGPR